MTAPAFGRKGVIGQPAQRRGSLVAHQPRSFVPADAAAAEQPESPRAALVAAPAGPTPLEWLRDKLQALRPAAKAEAAPADRSLKVVWPIWFLLGLAGGHRFYLRRPVTGAIMAVLFFGCLGAVLFAQRYEAFAGFALSWLWMLLDGIRMRKLFMTAGG